MPHLRREYAIHMMCPGCGADRSRVVDSRARVKMEGVFRMRQCKTCKTKWPTVEIPQATFAELKGKRGPAPGFSTQ